MSPRKSRSARSTPAGSTRIKEFGAFIEVIPRQDGLCHISELADGYVERVEDIVKLGDMVRVKVILIDDQGRVKLSRKEAIREEGKKDDGRDPAPRSKGGDGGGHGGGERRDGGHRGGGHGGHGGFRGRQASQFGRSRWIPSNRGWRAAQARDRRGTAVDD